MLCGFETIRPVQTELNLLGLRSCCALQVRELELNENLASVENLLTFLESIFNGGSDFKYAPSCISPA